MLLPSWLGRVALLSTAGASLFTIDVHISSALPPGRAWTNVQTFHVPGHTWVAPMWLDTDASGKPFVIAELVGGLGQEICVLSWGTKAWVPSWTGGFPTGLVWPALSPPGSFEVLWKGIGAIDTPQGPMSPLKAATYDGIGFGAVDSIGLVRSSSGAYSMSASDHRRWVVVSDNLHLRLLYSDSPGQWHEVPVVGNGHNGVAVAAVDDNTAIVSWAGLQEGLRWGTVAGSSWVEGPPLDPDDHLAFTPRFRRRPSGGHWLTWATKRGPINHLELRTYSHGSWSGVDAIPCAYNPPEGFYPTSPDLSRDGGEYPAAVWIAVNDQTGAESLCACMPTDSGFTVADNLPFVGLPTIARDRNGDVWIAWWDLGIGMSWLHSYTTAIAGSPAVSGEGPHLVSWTLTESAPETWWAVLRSADGAPYEVAGRVRAGAETSMQWIDAAPPPGALRYRIRRECVDAIHTWQSDETTVPVGVPTSVRRGPIEIHQVSPNPSGTRLAFSILNAAAGPARLEVFDVRGGLVARRTFLASGSGRDAIEADLSVGSPAPRSGLCFVRVVDVTGSSSRSTKTVVLN